MLLKAEHVSAFEDGAFAASPGACSETMVVHLTLPTQELFSSSSSDVLSHELCRFCALPLSAAPIFGAEVMPRSRKLGGDRASAVGRAEGHSSWYPCQNCVRGPEKPD